jgi:hypothetical protein
MFQVRNCRMEYGEVMPLLCRVPHLPPVVLPLIYTVLRRRHRAVSTLRRDAQIFKWLYEWVWFELNQDLDELLSAGQASQLIDKLEQFAFWLRTGRITSKIAGRIGNFDWLHPNSFNGYLQTVQLFLTWAIERYPATGSPENLRESIIELKTRIRSNFDAIYLGGASVVDVKGLDEIDLHTVFLILHPSAANNPFRRNTRVRNWLIFRLFAEAGPRRGELLWVFRTIVTSDSGLS